MVCADMVKVVVSFDGMEVDMAMEVDEYESSVGIQQQDDADENFGCMMAVFQEAMSDMAVMVEFEMEMAEGVEQIQMKMMIKVKITEEMEI